MTQITNPWQHTTDPRYILLYEDSAGSLIFIEGGTDLGYDMTAAQPVSFALDAEAVLAGAVGDWTMPAVRFDPRGRDGDTLFERYADDSPLPRTLNEADARALADRLNAMTTLIALYDDIGEVLIVASDDGSDVAGANGRRYIGPLQYTPTAAE